MSLRTNIDGRPLPNEKRRRTSSKACAPISFMLVYPTFTSQRISAWSDHQCFGCYALPLLRTNAYIPRLIRALKSLADIVINITIICSGTCATYTWQRGLPRPRPIPWMSFQCLVSLFADVITPLTENAHNFIYFCVDWECA